MAMAPAKKHHNHPSALFLILIMALLGAVYSQSCSVAQCDSCKYSDSSSCMYCNSGFYESNDKCCAYANPNCDDCSNSPTICDECESTNKYYLQNDLCVLCNVTLAHCLTCSSSTNCLSCESSQYAVNSNDRCQLCSDLMTDCYKCSDSNTCTQCSNDSYAVNSSSHLCVLCQKKLAYCLTCKNESVCISCESTVGISLVNSECLFCKATMVHCLECSSKFNCTKCETFYAPIPDSNCVLCQTIIYGCIECSSSSICTICRNGRLINGRCTSVVGCVGLTQGTTTQPICTSCNTTFHEKPVNGVCQCQAGHLAGFICTTLAGCLNAIRNSSGQFCLSCNISGEFILQQGKCICKVKYYLAGQFCQDICGDGFLMNIACDDGNLRNGDGCSSSCQIQQNYKCSDGSPFSKSECHYRGRVQLQFVSVKKVEYENKAIVTFTTSPQFSNLYQMDHFERLNFTTEANCTVSSTQLIGSYIYIQVEYFQNIEGKPGTYSIIYDQNYIISPPSKVSFLFYDLNKQPLLYDENLTPKNESVELCMLILSLLALAIFFISSYSHKMIGVETIHTFHVIFIIQALTSNSNSLMTNFKQMSFTLGSSSFLFGLEDSEETVFKRLDYANDLYYNFILVAAVQLFILLGTGVIKIITRIFARYRYHRSIILSKIIRGVEKLEIFYYDFLIFPIYIGFIYHFTLSLSRHSFSSRLKIYQPMQYQSIIILLTLIACSFIVFSQLKPMFLSQSSSLRINRQYKSNYVPIFLIYTIILSLFFQLEAYQILLKPYIYLGTIIGAYTIFLIAYRPYKQKIHNLSIIFYQLGICLCIFWLYYDSTIVRIRLVEEIICYLQLAWLFIVIILAVVREIFEIRRKKSQQTKQISDTKVKKSRYSDQKYQQGLREAILDQQSTGINPFRILAQHHRELDFNQKEQNKKRSQNKVKKLMFKDELKITKLINQQKKQIPRKYSTEEELEEKHFKEFKKQLRQRFKQRIPNNIEERSF